MTLSKKNDKLVHNSIFLVLAAVNLGIGLIGVIQDSCRCCLPNFSRTATEGFWHVC